jgi:hypothetical protein
MSPGLSTHSMSPAADQDTCSKSGDCPQMKKEPEKEEEFVAPDWLAADIANA